MTKRVLIIDDEENIRQMIRLTLESTDYEVGEAEDGYEALAILGGDSEWDVVLLDQRLPVMEGIEVLRRVKVLAPTARVVMMTAFPSVELAVDAMKLGASDFLRKPMTPEVVRNAVLAALKKTSNAHAHVDAAKIAEPLSRTITMNGFTILRGATVTSAADRANQQRFLVLRPDGSEQEVVVEISEQAVKEAEHVLHGQDEKAFWSEQAESFLSDFIWNDGNVPATGRLVLKGFDHEILRRLALQQRET